MSTAMNATTTYRPAVLRYRNGQTEQCSTAAEIAADIAEIAVDRGAEELEQVPLSMLKAIFFLREPRAEEEPEATPPTGSSVAVEFADGETMRGMAVAYNPAATGFFLVPEDRSKIDVIYVVSSALISIDVEKL